MKTPLKLHLSEYSTTHQSLSHPLVGKNYTYQNTVKQCTTHQSLSHPLVGKNIHYQVLPVPEYRNDPDRTKTSSNNE